MAVYAGLDIGGTKLVAAACEDDGKIIRRARRDTPTDLDEGLSILHEMTAEVCAGQSPSAIGAAIGGPLDWQAGVVSPLHQPRWRSVPLKSIMQDRWGCPFHVDVDTNIAALGEYAACDDPKPTRLLYVTISTGMGGGFLIDGKIYRGAGSGELGHPEIGHQGVGPGGAECECGAPDCLAASVSGNGIRRVYGKPAEQLTDTEWGDVARTLGLGLRNMAAILAPDVIVLGGGVALGGGQKLLSPARAVMIERLRIVPVPELRLSQLGPDAPLTGALVVAREGINKGTRNE